MKRARKLLTRAAPLALAALVLLVVAGCTQWGTSVLRTGDVWWACRDRHAPCSPEDASLTYLQMRNTYAGALQDLTRAKDSGKFSPRALEPTRFALEMAREANTAISFPPYWGEEMADFVMWTVKAEREAQKLYGKLYGYGG